ncbi:general stress protein [Lewinellaceae bacterium SD302]|nr:general stress protein [Lewinellaceae bacterium SD302]
MAENNNLFNAEAAAKIQQMIGDARVAMFCCNLSKLPIDVTPMAPQSVDDDGTVWFFSARDSDRNQYVQADSRAQVIVSNSGQTDHLSIYGKAELVNDPEKVKELWSPFAKVWFQEGPSDPNLTLLKFTPSEGYYWDTKHGKMISFAKMAASLVTGKTME